MEEDKQAVTRVANYPVVKDTWNRVSEVYQRGKDGSRILKFCGDVAETGASLAYKASMPVIERLPVDAVNDYAVQKLEKLEEQYPALVKPTEQVVDDWKNYSAGRLNDAKNYGTAQFNRLAEVARLNAVLDIADSVVDKLLPAPQVEGADDSDKPEAGSETPAVVEERPAEASAKLRMLSDKLKRRAYNNAMSRAGAIQRRSQEAVERLRHTVDLIDYAKQNIQDVSLESAQEKVKSVYAEVTREGEDVRPLPSNANLEQKTIFVARSMTLRARSTFATVSRLSYALPQHARTAVNDAFKYCDHVYQMFQKAESYRDFSGQMLVELRERLSFLEETANQLAHYILESAPLRWLATKRARPAIADQSAGNDSDDSDDTDMSSAEDDDAANMDETAQDGDATSSNYADAE